MCGFRFRAGSHAARPSRGRSERAIGAGSGRGVRRKRAGYRRGARRRAADRTCRVAGLQPGQGAGAVFLREWQTGARQVARRRVARRPMPICWRATGIRWRRCSSRSSRMRWMSTCIRQRQTCAFAMRRWCAGSSSAHRGDRSPAARVSRERGSAWQARSRPACCPAARAAHDWRQSPFAPVSARPGFARNGRRHSRVRAIRQCLGIAGAAEDAARWARRGRSSTRNYIIAQTQSGLVIVDQHAAHERIVYEAAEGRARRTALPRRLLLIPEIVELPQEDVARLLDHAAGFRTLGLAFEGFGAGAIAVRETPAMLGEVDVQALMRDLADETGGMGRCRRLAGTACGASHRAWPAMARSAPGRILKPDEMNALLRQIETHAQFGRMQSRQAHLHRIEAEGHRAAFRALTTGPARQ